MFITKLNWVDYITLSGVFFVCASVALVLKGYFAFALSLLCLAMSVDWIDGFLARRFEIARDFGRYLDSFVDVLDYLVAPSLFLYLWGFDQGYQCLILVLFIMSGIIRLSVFNEIGNVKNDEGDASYLGMPVYYSLFFLSGAFILHWIIPKETLFPLIALLFAVSSGLMVYRKKFIKFKLTVVLPITCGGTLLFAFAGIVSA
ncbi:CDP-alcohol phosphatidyltransferase family protein [Deltaproteobacteria bacterium TL4]